MGGCNIYVPCAERVQLAMNSFPYRAACNELLRILDSNKHSHDSIYFQVHVDFSKIKYVKRSNMLVDLKCMAKYRNTDTIKKNEDPCPAL